MSTSLTLTQVAVNHLNQIREWTHFLSIVGFVICALIGLAAILFGRISTLIPDFDHAAFGAIGTGMISVIYLVVAFVCFFLYLYLYRFSRRLKTALSSDNSDALADGFKNLKAHYRLTGIIAIVIIGFNAMGLLLGIIGAIAAMG